MKKIILLLAIVILSSFDKLPNSLQKSRIEKTISFESSFSLINDSKDKISIYTGTGFVSLNKGSKTSIGCNIGKDVCWAESGKKGAVIFKITTEMCGKTLKISEFTK